MLLAVVAGSFTSLLPGSLPWFSEQFLSGRSLRGVPGSKEGADTVFVGVTGGGRGRLGGVAHLKGLHRRVVSTGGHQTEHFQLTWWHNYWATRQKSVLNRKQRSFLGEKQFLQVIKGFGRPSRPGLKVGRRPNLSLKSSSGLASSVSQPKTYNSNTSWLVWKNRKESKKFFSLVSGW